MRSLFHVLRCLRFPFYRDYYIRKLHSHRALTHIQPTIFARRRSYSVSSWRRSKGKTTDTDLLVAELAEAEEVVEGAAYPS